VADRAGGEAPALVTAHRGRYDGSVREIPIAPTFESWQAAARELLRHGVPPAEVRWRDDAKSGRAEPAEGSGDPAPRAPVTRVPRQFIELAGQVARHRDPARWGVLYEVLWRLAHEDRELLKAGADPQVRRLFALAAQARREAHQAEVAEMLRVQETEPGAAAFVPAGAGLAELGEAARRCTGCELYRDATQTVFGRGPADARIVLVGEQPGDQEDRQGAPFVGPAGEVLDRALGEAGLVREQLYVTNAVKHFKFVERGKRRIHQTPRLAEIAACRPWLEAELARLEPAVVVCLGATAARALFGPDFRLLRERGRFLPTRWSPRTLATLHPSAVLRGEDDAAQERLYRMLVDDLRLAAAAIRDGAGPPAPSGP
jgi:uracil-DNA glycosylase